MSLKTFMLAPVLFCSLNLCAQGSDTRDAGGKNIISGIPASFTAGMDGNLNQPGVGISYERLLDKYGHIGISIPILVNSLSDKDYDRPAYSGSWPMVPGTAGYRALMFMPGVRFYPAAGYKRIRYSMGMCFFGIAGKEPYYLYSNGSSVTTVADHRFFVYGGMLSNAVNFCVMQHLQLSIEFNAGIPFSDNRYVYNSFDDIPLPIVQFAFKLGYRF